MFDVATRPVPRSANAGSAFGLPFDWRLAMPAAPASFPWADFSDPTGVPVAYAEMLVAYSLELEPTLQTAIILSLFTDARASVDDKLPLNETNRRGWVGDEFMSDGFSDRADNWGNLLWLCYIGKVTENVLEFARFTAAESLAWLKRDGIASRVTVTTLWTGEASDRLAVRPQIFKPGQVSPVYDALWGTSARRMAQ